MNQLRLLISAAVAFVVTVALFVLMPALIESADKKIDEDPGRKIADINMSDRNIQEQGPTDKPDKPDEPEQPPPEPDIPEVTPEATTMDNVVNINPGVSSDLDISIGTGIAVSDGEYMPLVRLQPRYPNRALNRGIEGYCVVSFTVTKAGTVRGAVPEDCQPSGYFEKASLKALEKFKYKPRVVDGQPIEVEGVAYKFTFNLEK